MHSKPAMGVSPIITEFLRSGNLGKLCLGMTLDSAIQYLGIPDDETTDSIELLLRHSVPDLGFLPLISYGCLELIFERGQNTLVSIQIELDDIVPRTYLEPFGEEWLFGIDGMNSNQFFEFLQSHQIEWYQEQMIPSGAMFLRVVPSQVGVSIDLEGDADRLYSLMVSVWYANRPS